VAAIVVTVGLICGVGVVSLLARRVAQTARTTAQAVASSPWNELVVANAPLAHIGGVLSIGDELLVELHWQSATAGQHPATTWLHGTTNAWTISTLARWHDAHAIVGVDIRETGTLLRAQRSALVLPLMKASQVST
jgi:hypothetical protein